MFSVVSQQGSAEREKFAHSRVGDSVVHRAVLAPRVHEPAPTQTREMIGQVRPPEAQPQGQLADRHLAALVQQLDHPHTGRIRQHLEVLGDQVGLGRVLRKQERTVDDGDSGHSCQCSLT